MADPDDAHGRDRFLESIYNGAEEAIFVVDIGEDGGYVFKGFNPAYLRRSRSWGVDMRTFLGRTTRDLRAHFPEDLVASVEAKYAECAASSSPIEFEDTLMADGRPTYWVTHLTALRDGSGRPYRLIGTSVDITRQKEDAARLRATEEQLRQSQKMDAIGRLAGGIAHDFNNLLTAINGYSELALHARDLDSAKEMAREIKRSGERAAALTGQLLAFSRKQILSPRVLDLNTIVSGMDSLLRRIIGEHIELAAFLAPDLSPIKVDAGQLEQIVLNLALNARDAMPGGGKLTIETYAAQVDENPAGIRLEGRPGPQVVLAVSDTGTGMSKEVLDRLFEPFYTTKEPGKGTGMGLATVYGIVNQSGGRIHVYSEPGRGSSFKVYFPAAEGISLPQTRTIPEAEPLAQGKGECILLVEDEEAVRSYAKRVLEGLGYRVLMAVHGLEALETVARPEPPIHLLLTDIVMPGMSGKELWERLKTTHPALRVLFMSGYADHAIVHHGVLDEDAPFLPKPFSPVQLARKVREMLGVPAAQAARDRT
jgi:two-component system, cell cycle sensor histidine kinase and response regulator CckA